jgi:hypothetical protein
MQLPTQKHLSLARLESPYQIQKCPSVWVNPEQTAWKFFWFPNRHNNVERIRMLGTAFSGREDFIMENDVRFHVRSDLSAFRQTIPQFLRSGKAERVRVVRNESIHNFKKN